MLPIWQNGEKVKNWHVNRHRERYFYHLATLIASIYLLLQTLKEVTSDRNGLLLLLPDLCNSLLSENQSYLFSIIGFTNLDSHEQRMTNKELILQVI